MSRRLLQEAGNSRAVIMGTWVYDDPDLRRVREPVMNSFNRFKNLLVSPLCGWPAASITEVANEPHSGRVPDLLMTEFAAATDVALFYYVGHGLLSDDEDTQLCLGLTGTVIKMPYRVVATSLQYRAVRHALLRSPARTKIVILDCCNSRLALPLPLGQTDAATVEAVPAEFLDETGVERAYVLVAASRKYTYCEKKSAVAFPQTFFTKYLADRVERGIDDGRPEPQLTLESLFRRLRSDLKDGGHSAPDARGNSGGDYAFCRNAALMPKPSPTTPEAIAESESAASKSIGLRRKWRGPPIRAAAAIVVVAVALTILAVAPGGRPGKPVSGPSPSLATTTSRPALSRTAIATPTKASATAKTKTPGRRPTENPARTRPLADASSAPTVTHGSSVAPTTLAPTTPRPTPAPTPKKTTSPPSGTQAITGYSGANLQSCAGLGAIGSASGGSDVGYSFINNSRADIYVWYLAADGNSTLKGAVAPGSPFSPGGVATGQEWMVADYHSGCMGIFAITGGGGVTAGS